MMLGDLAGRPNADSHGREETPGELDIQRDEHDRAVVPEHGQKPEGNQGQGGEDDESADEL